jgi:transcriptional regulator with XRE-family HTH domain
MLLPEQCRAGRAILTWSQADLAAKSGVQSKTIADFEIGKRTPIGGNLFAIQRAFETAGLAFVNGGEPGVKRRANGGIIAAEKLNASNDD